MSLDDGRRTAQVLVIEDDPGERRLLLEALDSGRARKNVSVAEDGVEAMAFLRREGKHAGAPRPDLILMPLAVPRKDGRRVIEEIRSDPTLKRIPILILTSSRSEEEINGAYESGANCYVVKPVEMDGFFSLVQAIEDFWLGTVVLPPEGEIPGG